MIRIQQFIAVLIVAGSLFAIVDGSDRYFPFSNYPMYARKFEDVGTYTFRGVRMMTEDGANERLLVKGLLAPFWMASYREALLVDRTDASIESKLRSTLSWYNRRRIETNAGAAVKSIRLYRYDIPWADLEKASLANEGFDELFRDHATMVREVSP